MSDPTYGWLENRTGWPGLLIHRPQKVRERLDQPWQILLFDEPRRREEVPFRQPMLLSQRRRVRADPVRTSIKVIVVDYIVAYPNASRIHAELD